MNTKSVLNLNTWVICPKPNPQARMRLFCFPYAGGGTSAFFRWTNHLPNDVELCLIQLPGRERRRNEPLINKLEPVRDALVLAIESYLDKPYAFFGHSMGSIICFELVRQLAKDEKPTPKHLFCSGRRAPQIVNGELSISDLPDQEFIKEMTQYNGIPREVIQEKELLQFFLPILRADMTLLDTYRYVSDKPLNCPISVFGGLDDTKVSREDLQAWSTQTTGEFSLRMFPGGHFYIRDVEQELLELIAQRLI